MNFDKDVLIVGGGPTGLMFACQLARFGVSCRIIDQQADRAHESRAFGIQARSMEIFQNLGIVAKFQKRAQKANHAYFYVHGKLRFEFNLTHLDVKDSPFPAIFLLPQSETEQILLEHLEKFHITVERQTELLSFSQQENGVIATIKKQSVEKNETFRCRYLIGCDGAHSTVRHILGIPFVGASYQQEFILIDTAVQWPFSKDNPVLFLSRKENLVHIPLSKTLSRLIIINTDPKTIIPTRRDPLKSAENTAYHPQDPILCAEEIENKVKMITGANIQLINPIWISSFRLHHRMVEQYQKGRVFLAGDSAHIHSPVGGQGMNTGLQDATNLAWKIAFIIKYQAPEKLLDTYQTERHRIGEVLLKTTDRLFSWVTAKNFFIAMIRLYVAPFFMKFLVKSAKFRKRAFCFISQLTIHYHLSAFVKEKTEKADSQFLSGPAAGYRAPDAPLNHSSLFELFKEKPCNILLFQPSAQQQQNIFELKKIYPDLIAVHEFTKSTEMQVLFDRYGITNSGAYFIRPDGYIGFRSYGSELDSLLYYLHRLFGFEKETRVTRSEV